MIKKQYVNKMLEYNKSILLILIVVITSVLSITDVKATQKRAVEVVHVGKDNIKIRLAYHIKEIINKSSRYRLSSVDIPRIKIMIVSADMADEIIDLYVMRTNLNIKSYMSLTYTLLTMNGEFYNGSSLWTVGANSIKQQAEEIVAGLNKFE